MHSITMDSRIFIHKEIIEIFINSIPSLFKYSSAPYVVSLETLEDPKKTFGQKKSEFNFTIIKITNVTNQGLEVFSDFFHKLNFKHGEEFTTSRYFDDYYITDHDMKLVNQEYKKFLEIYDEKIKINLTQNMLLQAMNLEIEFDNLKTK